MTQGTRARRWLAGVATACAALMCAASPLTNSARAEDSDETPPPGMPPCSAAMAAALDRLVPELMERHHVPGVSIAVIEDRRIAFDRQYGVRQAGRPEKVDRSTLFEACSMSKPPLAYLALQLVERDKLDLDRPLRAYLDGPYLEDQPLHERITARMVLSHTSGFPNWREGGWRSGGPLPVMFEPGSRFGYSGEGFLYLQRAMEHITGTPLETYVQHELFTPLGIDLSSYVWVERFDALAAAGHDADGKVKTWKPRFHRANAGYSLFCTPLEYAAFIVEIIREDRSAKHSLSSESIDAMLTPTTKATGRTPVKRSDRVPAGPVFWSLGWAIDRVGDGEIVYHGGSNGTGFRCYCELDRRHGTGLVIMTNGISGRKLWEAVVAEIPAP